MLKSSVLKIIQSFSSKEIIEFNDFLNSPFFNKKSGVVKLFNEIKKYYPDFTNENLGYEKIWSKIYPEKKYGYGVMKNLIFDLTKLAEQFITQQEYKVNEIQEFANLYKAIGSRNLISLLKSKQVFINKNLSDDNLKNLNISVEEFYFQLLKIFDIKIWISHFNDPTLNFKKDRQVIEDTVVYELFSQLINVCFLSEALSMNEKSSRTNVNFTKEILSNITEEVFQKIVNNFKNRSGIKFVLLNSSYLSYKSLKNLNDSTYYFDFKNFFIKNYKKMPLSRIQDFYGQLEALAQWNSDPQLDKNKEFFDCYEFCRNNNMLLDKNSKVNCLQIIQWTLVFFLEDRVEELEEYISYYSNFLEEEYDKENSLNLIKSIILFMKNDFEASLSIVSKINYHIPTLKVFTNKYTSMIYYEMNEYDNFLNSYDAAMHFLKYKNWKDDPLTKHRDKRAKEFYNALKSLFKIRDTKNYYDLSVFEKDIMNSDIDLKKWFLRKANELKKIPIAI